MEITRVAVKASRTLPHPTMAYANFKSEVLLEATLDPNVDEAAKCVQELQAQAESLVEEHAAELRTAIGEFARVVTSREKLRRLECEAREREVEVQQLRAELDETKMPLFAKRRVESCAESTAADGGVR